jgi:hypothetical protein
MHVMGSEYERSWPEQRVILLVPLPAEAFSLSAPFASLPEPYDVPLCVVRGLSLNLVCMIPTKYDGDSHRLSKQFRTRNHFHIATPNLCCDLRFHL